MPNPPFLKLEDALSVFAGEGVNIQSQAHVHPIHQHIAMRLVLEGGFDPDEITPHPPLRSESGKKGRVLHFDTSVETRSEQTVLGGLKTKDIDVVVNKAKVGPVVAVSVKGTTGAFRNLTNRMEEAIGDSTNLHIMYPGLVYGFLHLLRVNREGEPNTESNDVSVDNQGKAVNAVRRYHDVLVGLSGRRLVRDDYTRYESVGFAMVERIGDRQGRMFSDFPPFDSPLAPERFFSNLYTVYDLRFPYVGASMPELKRATWAPDSPALQQLGARESLGGILGYTPRTA